MRGYPRLSISRWLAQPPEPGAKGPRAPTEAKLGLSGQPRMRLDFSYVTTLPLEFLPASGEALCGAF
jgi:hypothetical protein